MDIRNSVTNLGKLRNCTEIAGYLRIVLMEKSEESDFANYVFPELTHITGYLLLFDVVKLTSIAQLFPNLRVIRGRELFLSAVLVVHHMPDLKEVSIFDVNYSTFFRNIFSVSTYISNKTHKLDFVVFRFRNIFFPPYFQLQ